MNNEDLLLKTFNMRIPFKTFQYIKLMAAHNNTSMTKFVLDGIDCYRNHLRERDNSKIVIIDEKTFKEIKKNIVNAIGLIEKIY